MTANEFRNQKIKNVRLAWEVYGHKISLSELENFTTEELKKILQIARSMEVITKVDQILKSRSD